MWLAGKAWWYISDCREINDVSPHGSQFKNNFMWTGDQTDLRTLYQQSVTFVLIVIDSTLSFVEIDKILEHLQWFSNCSNSVVLVTSLQLSIEIKPWNRCWRAFGAYRTCLRLWRTDLFAKWPKRFAIFLVQHIIKILQQKRFSVSITAKQKAFFLNLSSACCLFVAKVDFDFADVLVLL